MGLNTQLMIVNLTIHKWSGNKLDRTVSEETNDRYQTQSKHAARVYKSLIPREAMAELRKAYNAVYTYHHKNTLPWGDSGRRVLPAKHYFDYTSKMRELTDKAQREVNMFLRNYTFYLDEAKKMLGKMFNPDDYPTASEIASQFGIDISFEPLPDAGDFRVDLVNEEVEKIREQIAEQQQDMANQAMRELWERTYKVVKNMAQRLGDPHGKFKNSLVGNVIELTKLLPRMNVTGDEELNKLCHEIEAQLVKYDPKELRENDVARLETAKAADEIVNKMAAYMGGAS